MTGAVRSATPSVQLGFLLKQATMAIQKSGTFGVLVWDLPGRGTSWHKSGTSRMIRDGWQPTEGTRTEAPKAQSIEARRAEVGVGFLAGGSQSSPHQLGDLGSAVSSQQGLRRSPSQNQIWCIFILKKWHLVARILMIFLKITWSNFVSLCPFCSLHSSCCQLHSSSRTQKTFFQALADTTATHYLFLQ